MVVEALALSCYTVTVTVVLSRIQNIRHMTAVRRVVKGS